LLRPGFDFRNGVSNAIPIFAAKLQPIIVANRIDSKQRNAKNESS
jgi:hypothetical protein